MWARNRSASSSGSPSRPRDSAAKPSIICCSTARRDSARPPSPRSSRRRWTSDRADIGTGAGNATDLAGLKANLGRSVPHDYPPVSPVVEEYLYPAIEDYCLDIMIDRDLAPVACGSISKIHAHQRHHRTGFSARSAAGLEQRRLDYHGPEELTIIRRSARSWGFRLTAGARSWPLAPRDTARGKPFVEARSGYAETRAEGRSRGKWRAPRSSSSKWTPAARRQDSRCSRRSSCIDGGP